MYLTPLARDHPTRFFGRSLSVVSSRHGPPRTRALTQA
ncbi:hypothetical protein WN943_011704 [Citrus x changshan-huyou]